MRITRFRGSNWLILSLLILIITGCIQEPTEPDIPVSRTEVLQADQIPGLLTAIAPYVNPALAQRDNIMSSNQGDTYFGMSIDFDHIIARLDSAGHTDFSMRLDDKDDNAFTFSNLVISKDESGEFYQPFIMSYTMDMDFAYQFFRTKSLEGFSGKIKRAYLKPIQAPTQQSSRGGGTGDPDDCGSDRDQPSTTCESEVVLSGGTSNTGDPGGGASYQVCEVVEYTYYEYDENGVRSVWYSVIAYENCEWISPTNSSSDSDSCPEDNSDVPVNPPDDPEEELFAEKPKKEYETVCEALQELWDSYPDNEVGGYITPEGKVLFTDVLPMDGGDMQGLYIHEGNYYYRWRKTEGDPTVTHQGMVTTGTFHIVPIAASFHTHTRCRARNTTDGLVSPGKRDKRLAKALPGIRHWAIGCDAVAQFKPNVSIFTSKSTGDLSDICSNVN